MPRASRLITSLSMPSRRRWPLRTIRGSKLPAGSRGTSRSTEPASVISGCLAHDLPLPCATRRPPGAAAALLELRGGHRQRIRLAGLFGQMVIHPVAQRRLVDTQAPRHRRTRLLSRQRQTPRPPAGTPPGTSTDAPSGTPSPWPHATIRCPRSTEPGSTPTSAAAPESVIWTCEKHGGVLGVRVSVRGCLRTTFHAPRTRAPQRRLSAAPHAWRASGGYRLLGTLGGSEAA